VPVMDLGALELLYCVHARFITSRVTAQGVQWVHEVFHNNVCMSQVG